MADLENAPGVESDGEIEFLNHLQNWGKEADDKSPSSPKKEQEEVHEEEAVEETEAEVEAEETPSETPEEETADDGEPEDDEALSYLTDDDDAKHVRIKVGDEEQAWTIKDLKRLAGQEASITKKGQDIATARSKLEAEQKVTSAAQDALLQAARKRFEPYSKLDFLALSRRTDIPAEQFQALREEAQHRYNEVQFLEQEARAYSQQIQQRNHQLAVEEAKASVASFQDSSSPYHIDGWNQGVYDELRNYAYDKGVPKQIVDSVTNPAIIKMFHTAMQADKGQQLKSVKTVKVGKSVTKVIKNTSAPDSAVKQTTGDRSKFGDKSKAMANLKRTGSMDSAANAFMASFREFDTD